MVGGAFGWRGELLWVTFGKHWASYMVVLSAETFFGGAVILGTLNFAGSCLFGV